jgi:anti-anti-sigma factor
VPETEPVFVGQALEAYDAGGGVAHCILTQQTISEPECEALLADLTRAMRVIGPRLVVDCIRVEHVSSAMLGTLVRVRTRVKEEGGALALFDLPKQIKEVITLTRLDAIFPVADDLEGAIKAVNGAAGS